MDNPDRRDRRHGDLTLRATSTSATARIRSDLPPVRQASPRAEEGRAAADHRRPGRAVARRWSKQIGRRHRAGGKSSRLAVNAVGGLERLAVLHTAAARVGGLDLGFVPAAGASSADRDACEGHSTCCSCSAPTRYDFSKKAPSSVYIGTHGDAGAPRRRHPAGCRLHREVGHLRQHRGPRAARQPRRLRAGRGPRRLGDPARALAMCSARSCRSIRSCSCARSSMPSTRTWRGSTRSGLADLSDLRRSWRAPMTKSATFASPIADFYLTNPIARASASWPNARRCRRFQAGSMSKEKTMDVVSALDYLLGIPIF
jgi:NADH-quinone oxidoreductase subunit G